MTTQSGGGSGDDLDWFASPARSVTAGDDWGTSAGRVPEMRVEPVLAEALFTESVLPDARQSWDPFGSPPAAETEPGAEPEVTVVAAVGVVDGVPVAMVDGAAVAVVDGVPTVTSAAGGHADAVASAAAEGLSAAPRLTAQAAAAQPVAPEEAEDREVASDPRVVDPEGRAVAPDGRGAASDGRAAAPDGRAKAFDGRGALSDERGIAPDDPAPREMSAARPFASGVPDVWLGPPGPRTPYGDGSAPDGRPAPGHDGPDRDGSGRDGSGRDGSGPARGPGGDVRVDGGPGSRDDRRPVGDRPADGFVRDVGGHGNRIPAAWGGPVEAEARGAGMHRHAPGEARGGSGDGGFDPSDSGTWRIAHVAPGMVGGRRTTTIVRYLLGLLAVDRLRATTRWAYAVPVAGALLLLVRPRWIGAAVLVLGVLLVAGRIAAIWETRRQSLPHRFRPVEEDLRAAVEGGKSNLRGELDRVGASGGTLALVRLARGSAHSDVKARLREIEIDRVLPRAQLERALRVLDLAPPSR